MSHLVFYWFCHEIRVASMARLLPAYAAWFPNSLDAPPYLGTPYHQTRAALWTSDRGGAGCQFYSVRVDTRDAGRIRRGNVQVLLDFPDPFGVHLDAHISPM